MSPCLRKTDMEARDFSHVKFHILYAVGNLTDVDMEDAIETLDRIANDEQ